MKKETINTFEGGLVKDLHPLTTPKNVLTDALNATYITYNGNEYILQNDMGNVEIKNALLKAGYVPVGMKEHGGIVYVAAYNPKTGKGQVGSFPSPKQLWESENWTVNSPATIINAPTITPNFYNGSFIVNEILKKEIFTTDGDPRIFHPGDKFVIGIASSTYNSLKAAINADYMDMQLGVVKSDGGIEVMRTWSKTSPDNIFYVGDATSQGVLNNKNIVKVFDASSSGQLLLILNLHTFDSFSLNRKYSLVSGNTIQVKFTGEGQKDKITYLSNGSDGKLRLSKEQLVGSTPTITASDQTEINVEGTSGKTKLTIYPNVPFGIIKRMGRTMTVDFDKIRNNQDDFGEWRFFVTDTYVKIGWSYDYYNLDETKEIEYIRMYFHALEDGYTATNKESRPHVEFQREYYSGNFEDYINYADIGLTYKRIYIVEIVKKFKNENNEETIDFKMLYLSKLYNSKYNGFYENKSIGLFADDSEKKLEFEKANNVSVPIKLEINSNFDLASSVTKVRKPGEQTLGYETPTSEVSPSMYIQETTDVEYDQLSENSKIFVSQIKNTYNGSIEIKGKIEDTDDMYIGRPRTDIIRNLMQLYSVNILSIENEKEWQENTSVNKVFPDLNPGEDPALDDDVPSVTNISRDNDSMTVGISQFSDYILLQGFSSELKSNTFDTKGLKPLFSPSYAKDRKDRVAPFWSSEDMLCISGEGDHDKTMWHHSTLTLAGNIVRGPDSGGGCADGGLGMASSLMGRPIVNIFAGTGDEDAEITFDNLKQSTATLPNGRRVHDPEELDVISNEVDNNGNVVFEQGDEYLIACWKFTDNEAHFVNLITPKKRPVRSDVKWPRLDVMLRCILSQIFIVNKVSKTINYITTNERFYRYQEGKTVLKFKLTRSNSNQVFNNLIKDIMVSEFSNNNKTLNGYLEDLWHFNGSTITINKGTQNEKSYAFTNLIPSVAATLPDTDDMKVEVPNYYDLAQILEYYQGANYHHIESNDSEYELGAIYSVDVTKDNASVCAKDGLKANFDGTYEWDGTPECVKVTDNMSIYRWNDASTITFPHFGRLFTTKAALYEWVDIPEGEENEVYAKTDNAHTPGQWTDGDPDEAPSMYYTTLYSPQISALADHL